MQMLPFFSYPRLVKIESNCTELFICPLHIDQSAECCFKKEMPLRAICLLLSEKNPADKDPGVIQNGRMTLQRPRVTSTSSSKHRH